MLSHLKLTNVGPAPSLELSFSSRLNILTGDNGLGKSFLLDIAWWALTRRWPAQVNPRLAAGLLARPRASGTASIGFQMSTALGPRHHSSRYDRNTERWTSPPGRSFSSALVLYAMVDGSFAVWDPARNSRWNGNTHEIEDRAPFYVFTPEELWNGLQGERGPLSNGLVRDWAGWQKENGMPFLRLSRVLEALSPSPEEHIRPGPLTRISLDDPRDIPTLDMPYGPPVPVLHASAGMRRVLALAYLLVWSWEEHLRASELLEQEPTGDIIFLIDEIEAHLHPRWQRRIVQSLLSVMDSLTVDVRVLSDSSEARLRARLDAQATRRACVQLVATTHSPLVLASLEPCFDAERDAWFDLDLVPGEPEAHVAITRRPFVRRGDASSWLVSDAFDLRSARSLEAERALEEASLALTDESFDIERARAVDARLRQVLGDTDPFWMSWRFVGERRGWLP